MKDLSLDLATLRVAYESGLDPHALIDLVFDRIEAAIDPGIFIALRPRADVHAEMGATRMSGKPLWGVPFAVKDNIDVAGLPTTAACPDFAYMPEADAACVARLRAAGAIVIGKTNLDQFATGLAGLRTPYLAPRNSFDAAIVPGGSSSGSAVAVARGSSPSRSAPTRPAPAACPPRSTISSASSPVSAPYRRAASFRPAERSIASPSSH